jgi:hypothetical protein
MNGRWLVLAGAAMLKMLIFILAALTIKAQR